jgi:dinuclear metal center YbgI/SA1388 family protein
MILTTRHISDFIERWAPSATKLEYDNTGLLTGNPESPVQTILTCLDVTHDVIKEAISVNADLIVAHHPLIFPKIKQITETDPVGSMLRLLIKNDIDLIAAHTNLDASRTGVSVELAKLLGLKNIQFLDESFKTLKLVVLRFPAKLREKIQQFLDNSNFEIGWSTEERNIHVARFNYDGIRLPDLQKQIHAILNGSPYSIDVIPSEASSVDFGFGAIGTLETPILGIEFIQRVESVLDCRSLRFAGNPDSMTIKTVAVCGGSGASLINKAFKSGADAYVTADIKYHEFFIPEGKLLIDAGHYETEAPIIKKLAVELQQAFPEIRVLPTSVNTNPMFGVSQFEFLEKK